MNSAVIKGSSATFSEMEVMKLLEYFLRREDIEIDIKPITEIQRFRSPPADGMVNYLMFSKDKKYNLPFKVCGLFDIREREEERQLVVEDVIVGILEHCVRYLDEVGCLEASEILHGVLED